MVSNRITVRVADRQLSLSNLDKLIYPAAGFTKGQVIDYYRQVAPVLLPHLAGRPVTFVRFPNGVSEGSFFEKDVSRHAPDWVRTARLPADRRSQGSGMLDYPLVDGLPSLVWAANLAALELHVPQWTVGRNGSPRSPDRLVFDLDPGAPADVVSCCRVAERLYPALTDDGLTPVVKTSGSKGLQVYCAVRTRKPDQAAGYARALAERLAAETPDLVVSRMDKALRPGKVFIDWSQNNPAKTTIAPYSLRGRPQPTVSTPLTWAEVSACRNAAELVFTAPDVLARVAELGDLFAGLTATPAPAVPDPA